MSAATIDIARRPYTIEIDLFIWDFNVYFYNIRTWRVSISQAEILWSSGSR